MIFFVGPWLATLSSHRDQTCIFSVTYFMFCKSSCCRFGIPPERKRLVRSVVLHPETEHTVRHAPSGCASGAPVNLFPFGLSLQNA